MKTELSRRLDSADLLQPGRLNGLAFVSDYRNHVYSCSGRPWTNEEYATANSLIIAYGQNPRWSLPYAIQF